MTEVEAPASADAVLRQILQENKGEHPDQIFYAIQRQLVVVLRNNAGPELLPPPRVGELWYGTGNGATFRVLEIVEPTDEHEEVHIRRKVLDEEYKDFSDAISLIPLSAWHTFYGFLRTE